ncbi:Oidioi.mRNA.OKI2018_I69.PAR.g8676.t1.cds [Oikopleura dioica]|uniref:Oidioi.mRNA.OKI2018_I69.PAR.g8676.t1.cds n=1 Tax=Oikopleura dioica TaxID=34765 RepID=A0ABN7RH64_OIKDI|nr:Oidioi.mRNA.OKI2018_I69.PAR.g8676.t1.cds [Oikopleura dioica]
MRILASLAAPLVSGSHFRGGSYQYRYDAATNSMTVIRSMIWKRYSDSYSGGCSDHHVQNEIPSNSAIDENIYSLSSGIKLLGPGNSGTSGNYIVNEIEDSSFIPSGEHYCAGSIEEQLAGSVNEPFYQDASSCCTVTLYDDNGSSWSGSFRLQATVYDITNNSPAFRAPSQFTVMTGCENQVIELNPVDSDGDTVRCRWATSAEAADWPPPADKSFNSFELDEEKCTITYRPEFDNYEQGIRPIAIQFEDFDANNQIRSSMPAQFMIKVFTPTLPSGRNRRTVDLTQYPHCEGSPTFDSRSPANGDQLKVHPTNGINVKFYASYMLGTSGPFYDLDRFSVTGPSGMTCSSVDKAEGSTECDWTPTASQILIGLHDVCAMAFDPIQRPSPRVCIKLDTNAGPGDRNYWLESLAPGFAGAFLNNYGCQGRGLFEPFSINKGKPVDEVDIYLNQWKKCARCSIDVYNNTVPVDEAWIYPVPENNVCADDNLFEKAICECDKALATALSGLTPDPTYSNYDSVIHCGETFTGIRGRHPDPKCCQNEHGYFQMYSIPSEHCCENNKLKPTGTCSSDNGFSYLNTIKTYHPEL